MKKENLKETLINSIMGYVVGAINNDFVEEEMINVKEGVYIAHAADKKEPWSEKGCKIIWKDSEGNVVKRVYLILDWFANDFGDLVLNGRTYIEDMSREIYREIFEEAI